jgi:hypothetical protein
MTRRSKLPDLSDPYGLSDDERALGIMYVSDFIHQYRRAGVDSRGSIATDGETEYIYMIYGVFPDKQPKAAFRRAVKFKDEERQKTIKCPYCGKPMTTVDVSTRVEIYRYPKKEGLTCSEYRKCHACHERVGIVFT